ncbi:DUF2851 family protein [Epilithonimonas hispanica]|uniref:DUF2851 domain-containing protein n=1 Tax=Epilithonimonas hispanica TaxID=358687 RepID=A0A3D9D2B6_9FLAO|nr:DUF2851 family protein [Epilithonimonas hispanica]REC72146.1 DUF2851 domain-containing protein [Epilithonimonas hispanica]
MNEEILQYLWNFKKFGNFDFISTDGRKIEILEFGEWNKNSGPDFLFAKIKIDDLIFAGNIEIHIKASDWFFHNHSGNPEFGNLILHAVYINDCDIPELEKQNIPTLELKNYIDEELILKHQNLSKEHSFIACDELFDKNKIPLFFQEEVLLKKLDEKSEIFGKSLLNYQNNYEAVLFQNLAYTFGLKVNAEIFLQMAESLDFSIVQKIKQNPTQLEALFFGICDFLDESKDERMQIWKREFDFLKVKFNLSDFRIHPKFSKLRPPNFPTIRLSQLANLYHSQPNLFSKLIEAKSIEDLYKIFEDVKASGYWDNRFNFGKISSVESKKYLSQDFIDLIIINTILPLKYFYYKNHNPEIVDDIFEFYKQMKPEKNSVLDEWKKLGLKFENASQTQAFLYQYKVFCNQKKCLNCSIGFQLLNNDR